MNASAHIMTAAVDETAPQTDLEELELAIAELQARVDAAGVANRNIWDIRALERLKASRDAWYDENGKRRPYVDDDEPPIIEFSPAEVVGVDGWQNIVPVAYGDIPKKYAPPELDPNDGLDISVARSNGCFRIRNQYESGLLWIERPAEVAAYYREKYPNTIISERVIRMAGYRMANWWIMLPTCFITGAYTWMDDYTFEPALAPFNDEEQRVFKEMFYTYHFSGGALVGAGLQAWPLQLHPSAPVRERENVGSKYLCCTIANHPQWILPAVMTRYNFANFKYAQYRSALSAAHAIDADKREPADGYGDWKEFSPHADSYSEFCQRYEKTAVTFTPPFEPKAEF